MIKIEVVISQNDIKAASYSLKHINVGVLLFQKSKAEAKVLYRSFMVLKEQECIDQDLVININLR
ncbi:MAG: hypothetical protein ACJ71R_23010 [Nitrososphaeraceae archaeon]